MVFKQHLVFGRAVFACEQLNILSDTPAYFATSGQGATSAPNESYALYFPYICQTDYQDRWHGDSNVTGIIVIEGVMQQRLCSTLAFPCGLVVFRCTTEERNEILSTAKFCNRDIVSGHVQVVWLSASEIKLMHSELGVQQSVKCHTWSALWCMAEDKLRSIASSQDVNALPTRMFHFEMCALQNIFDSWSDMIGSWSSGERINATVLPREMTPLEHLWIFFHVALRWRRELNVDPLAMKTVLKEIKVNKLYNIDPALRSRSILSENKIEQEYHGMMAELTGTCNGLADDLLAAYDSLCETLKRVKSAFKVNLAEAMQEKRREFRRFPLYTSSVLKTFTEKAIDTVPLTMFDYDRVSEWSLSMRDVLQKEVLNADKVFESIYEKVRPVWTSGDKNFLRLYGNVNGLLDELKKKDPAVVPLKYCVERLGELKTNEVESLPLYGMRNAQRDDTPFSMNESSLEDDGEKEKKLIHARLTESVEHCTPIWATPTESGMSFLRIVPILGRKRKRAQEVDSVENLIAKHMYPMNCVCETMTNEYLQSGTHWSTFVADIDLKLEKNTPRPDVKDIARDSVEMLDRVFETIFKGQKIKRHMVYSSRNDAVADINKIGIHHHAVLPSGMVFTSTTCREMADILDMVRHSYPDTLGVGTFDDKSGYDKGIYPVSMPSGYHKGHCLRGPFQVKVDGTRKLELVLDTQDHLPIMSNDVAVQGRQSDDITGERVIFGRVLNKLTGIHYLTDVDFFKKYETNVMTESVEAVCSNSVKDIAREINKRTVLFTDETNSVALLLSIINSLWTECDGKSRMIEHLETTVGSRGKTYDKSLIWKVSKCSRFVYNNKHGTVNLVVDKNLKTFMPFCVRRPHNSRTKGGVSVTVGYSAKMIRFVLFVSHCFKSSCQTCQQRNFLPDVVLSMPNIFVCPAVERNAAAFFRRKFHGSTVRVVHIDRRSHEHQGVDEDLDVEQVSIKSEDVVHSGKGAYVYVDEGNFINSVRRLFMFVPDRILAFSLIKNMYLVCVVHEELNSNCVYASPVSTFVLRYLTNKKLLPSASLEHLKVIMNEK